MIPIKDYSEVLSVLQTAGFPVTFVWNPHEAGKSASGQTVSNQKDAEKMLAKEALEKPLTDYKLTLHPTQARAKV